MIYAGIQIKEEDGYQDVSTLFVYEGVALDPETVAAGFKVVSGDVQFMTGANKPNSNVIGWPADRNDFPINSGEKLWVVSRTKTAVLVASSE